MADQNDPALNVGIGKGFAFDTGADNAFVGAAVAGTVPKGVEPRWHPARPKRPLPSTGMAASVPDLGRVLRRGDDPPETEDALFGF